MYRSELTKNAMGGTELMSIAIENRVPSDLLDKFQIWPSRVDPEKVDQSKKQILFCHDLPDDPQSAIIANGGWNQFEKIVFVSNWQLQGYQQLYGIPWYKCIVMQNAIEPIECAEKAPDKIKLIYNTTPHRGLEILVPVFEQLAEQFDNIELDVFSSFKAYGWDDRDEPYKELFERCERHPKINYHGFQPNDVVRKALSEAHIHAYPSIWKETSCISLMEAMSARCLCVHPNYGALYETAANWTWMYQWVQDKRDHARILKHSLATAIADYWTAGEQARLDSQKSYADVFYNWQYRQQQWVSLLSSMV